MTKFEDGPAAKTMLQLRRAPFFLRVVTNPETGEVDALDQLDDKPAVYETIHVYYLRSNDGMIHINSRERKTGRHTGGTYTLAVYRLWPDQPDNATVRSNDAWRKWAVATKAAADAKPKEA